MTARNAAGAGPSLIPKFWLKSIGLSRQKKTCREALLALDSGGRDRSRRTHAWGRPMKRKKRIKPVSDKTRRVRWPQLKAMRVAVLERAGGRCEVCGKTAPLDVHHIVKRSRRLDDSPFNGAALCRDCHNWTDESKWGYRGRLIMARTCEGVLVWASDNARARDFRR